ncbi:Spc24 subunit of Ndc80-domain-containing protein [Lentinula aff. detonsa]|uniref:Kinetochore protein Spc24 n=1 Tax=Lentinula aff. detonsa TaxID=2804958 RepID=A0AA38NLT7_9AGAR|nr:Spc24 subunit of Ndc80-domain-containing protein [Lentinula aff. detonsa]
MSIEISETIKVIMEMTAMMDPEDDYNTIVEAEEKIKASRAQKDKELEEAHANLKALSKNLEVARQSAKRPKSVPSAEVHAATVNELDDSKLSLAKSISDAENLLASQEAELAALKEEYQSLEHYDPATEHEKDLDGTALRLKIYRGMGFDIAMNDKNQVSNVLVRSQSGDVHPVSLDVDQPQTEYTHQLWKLAAS